jgi:hypothetical protein
MMPKFIKSLFVRAAIAIRQTLQHHYDIWFEHHDGLCAHTAAEWARALWIQERSDESPRHALDRLPGIAARHLFSKGFRR